MAVRVPPWGVVLKKGVDFFQQQFNKCPTKAGVGAARVNVIGEHTDYQLGFVLPMALPMVTIVLGSRNHLDECKIATESSIEPVNNLITFDIPSKTKLVRGEPLWGNYVKGVVNWFPGDVPGFNAVVVSTVPCGAGLSSSAALEVATFSFLEALTNQHFDHFEKALICQKAEHTFANVPCGIMDQLISVKGVESKLLLIDCRSLEAELVQIQDDSIGFLIINSRVRHFLGGSDEYAKRKAACEKVSSLLNIKALRDASMKEIDALFKKELISEVVYRRARHVIKENTRVYQAVHAIKKRDYEALGLLMLQSHFSLRFDFEVSCPELDSLVDIAMNTKGVYGARMTGAGFGGCTVNLVKMGMIDEIITEIKLKYTMSVPEFFVAVPSNGARIINLDNQNSLSNCDVR